MRRLETISTRFSIPVRAEATRRPRSPSAHSCGNHLALCLLQQTSVRLALFIKTIPDNEETAISTGISKLSADTRRIVDQLQDEALVPPRILAGELSEYTNELQLQAQREELFDHETAKKVATLCHRLLAALPESPSERQHRLTQLAINYFVLAEDAQEDDYSMDDDLQVVTAVIEELGLNHLLE